MEEDNKKLEAVGNVSELSDLLAINGGQVKMTLEQLLRRELKGVSPVSGEPISYSPEFRVSVQKKTDDGVHIIVHANGHNSDTLDFFFVKGDNINRI